MRRVPAAPPASAHYKVSQSLNSAPEVAFHSADYAGESFLLPTKILPNGNSTPFNHRCNIAGEQPGLCNDQRLILRHAGAFVLNTVRKTLCALALSFSIYPAAHAALGGNRSFTPNSVIPTPPNSSAATVVARTDTLPTHVVVAYRLVIGGNTWAFLTASGAAGSGSIPGDVVASNFNVLKNGNRPNTFALCGLTSADEAAGPAEYASVRALFNSG